MKATIVIVSALLMFVACSNPKEASKANFKQALNAYFQKAPIIASFGIDSFPAFLEKPKFIFDNTPYRSCPFFEKQALLSSRDTTPLYDSTIWNWKSRSSDRKTVVQVPFATKIYDLTPKGKSLFVTTIMQTLLGQRKIGGFQIATRNIKSITSFTEPADMFGKKVSTVSYVYEITNVSEFCKDGDFKTLFPNQFSDISKKGELSGQATMVLTSEGWVHSSMVQ